MDETHFWFGANNDLSIFSSWTQYYRERSYDDKNGGGKMRIEFEVRIITNYSSHEGIAQFAILWLKFEHTPMVNVP